MSEAEAFRSYLEAHVPMRPLKRGELRQSVGIYTPIELDEHYGKVNPPKGSQAESYGRRRPPRWMRSMTLKPTRRRSVI